MMRTNNFFKQERSSTLRQLLEHIREKGYKNKCPTCESTLTEKPEHKTLECPKCKPLQIWPCLPAKQLLALFRFHNGCTEHTLTQYIKDLIDAGLIEYVEEKGTYRTL